MHRLLPVVAVLSIAQLGHAAELVWLDGRRETTKRIVVKQNSVLIATDRGLRSVSKRRIVKALNDDGESIALDRGLRDVALRDTMRTALAALREISPDQLPRIQEQLADSLSRAVMKHLVELAGNKQPEIRARAATTLLMMGVDEPLRAGLSLARQDKDKKVRLRLASALFQVLGALEASSLIDEVAKGLSDRDQNVRTAFALVLGRLGDQRALPVLKTGLKNRDHHVRESAAEALAELGSDAGVNVLIGMLSRKKHPGGSALPEQVVIDEKIRICGYLARLRAKKALTALKRAARSKNPELAAAAKRAVDAMAG